MSSQRMESKRFFEYNVKVGFVIAKPENRLKIVKMLDLLIFNRLFKLPVYANMIKGNL